MTAVPLDCDPVKAASSRSRRLASGTSSRPTLHGLRPTSQEFVALFSNSQRTGPGGLWRQ